MTDDKTRAEFQAWYLGNMDDLADFRVSEKGFYEDIAVQVVWRGWQAAKGRYGQRIAYGFVEVPIEQLHDNDLAGSFQSRVQPWLLKCFGEMIAGDREERNHRFLEEALELVQALGATREEAHKLADYVYDRPVGEPRQEVGGVMVTLAALCLANDLDMHADAEAELLRISHPDMVIKIREKQKNKPAMGPLPGVYPERKEVQS